MGNFKPNPEQPEFSSLAKVSAIEESRNQMITAKEQLRQFVEQPLLDACEELYDKNIRTLATSANEKDIQTGEAYIIIDFDSLSEENKRVAQQYAKPMQYDGMNVVKIIIPVSEMMSPDEISQQAKKIADTFQRQSATWVPRYTLDDLKKIYGIDETETKYDDPSTWEGYFYDPESKQFYLSEEHFKKANEENNPE